MVLTDKFFLECMFGSLKVLTCIDIFFTRSIRSWFLENRMLLIILFDKRKTFVLVKTYRHIIKHFLI